MNYKKSILTLHKILGLATGIVVFIVAVTGCCWVFKEEVESLSDGYKKVVPIHRPMLTATEAKTMAKTVFPDRAVHGTVFKKADDALEVIFYEREPEFYRSVFLNPYTGEIIEVEDHLSGFFAFILKGHMRLWLPKQLGEQVVGISVVLFVLILVSGFILWMPKKRQHLKQRLRFDWKATTRWKRKNFDLHSIIGFYVGSLSLILALTGLVMSYHWFQYGLYKTVGGQKEVTFSVPKNSSTNVVQNTDVLPIDKLVPLLKKSAPEADSFELHYPYDDTSSIYVEVSNSEGLYYNTDYRYFDRYTLQEIPSGTIYGKYTDTDAADKLLRMNYDIHIGAIGGIAGKIIAFLVSLLTASLPITGSLLWYGRRHKKKKKQATT
ncbi:PepSY-associated TM helix domain-containing protein [Pareuzebyella sediminis]|uniref:PepSY-associated TM helix domain-containing protein n=1 Tax=Pareuzebyella sediminis TaxID=2607998 RepID=UPI0011EF1AA1|nr:PepSY-associated TM helix domain-containing protein [Pareuzebyella sediminis]